MAVRPQPKGETIANALYQSSAKRRASVHRRSGGAGWDGLGVRRSQDCSTPSGHRGRAVTWGCGAGLADMIADNETTANLIGWFVHRVLKALLA